jgi:hypothetical protein
VTLFFIGVLKKFSCDTLSMNPRSREMVPPIPEHTDNLRSECLVKQPNYGRQISSVSRSNRPLLNVLAGAFAQSFDVCQKWFISHDFAPVD